MTGIIKTILEDRDFRSAPIVLLDIGSAGKEHSVFRKLAPYAICIACDGDTRINSQIRSNRSGYKELYVIDSLVVDHPRGTSPFFLTSYPYCSSTLRPNQRELDEWHFAEFFEIKEIKECPDTDFTSIFKNHNISRVDWFKTDSQGTDLRLFRSLGPDMIQKVLAAEFEPGLINGYEGEDKVHDILKEMNDRSFFLCDLKIGGGIRLQRSLRDKYFNASELRALPYLHKVAPGWVEMTYLNPLKAGRFTRRDHLVSWVFATLLSQHGFALEIAHKGVDTFKENLFKDLVQRSIKEIKKDKIKYPILFVKEFLDKLK